MSDDVDFQLGTLTASVAAVVKSVDMNLASQARQFNDLHDEIKEMRAAITKRLDEHERKASSQAVSIHQRVDDIAVRVAQREGREATFRWLASSGFFSGIGGIGTALWIWLNGDK